MDILIIGGKKFLGRALVDLAMKRGHNLTLFNRGQTNPNLYPKIEQIKGDRDGEISNLGDRKWDVVIDTCGYVPRVVRSSVEYLKDKANAYVFISTISVYAESSEIGRDETAEVIELEDKTTEDIMGKPENYGGLKYLCELEILKAFTNSIIIRSGLIVGPYDPTNRFTYWPVRIRKGGRILVNNDKNFPIQIIDVRDLAEFIIKLMENQIFATYNVTGPNYQLTTGILFNKCEMHSRNKLEYVEANDQFLLDNEVQPWMEFPLWIPSETGRGLMQVSINRALANGLNFRSLEITIKDTLDWYDRIDGDNQDWPAGLLPEKELKLLSKL